MLASNPTVNVLIQIRDKIADEADHCRYELTRVKDGRRQYCVLGALMAVLASHSVVSHPAWRALEEAAKRIGVRDGPVCGPVIINNEYSHAETIRKGKRVRYPQRAWYYKSLP